MVPAFRRRPSGVQYIDTAIELAEHTIRYTSKKFAKKDMDLVRTLRNISFDIVKDVNFANSLYGSDLETVNLRRTTLLSARGKCWSMGAVLSSIFREIQCEITEYGWKHWGELLDQEIGLITSILQSDKERANRT